MNKYIGIIPARYASTRFPGKPLALVGGKPMIQRVYERVAEVLPEVLVATDDKRIAEAVEAFGGKCVMTSELHRSGTDRCLEAFIDRSQLESLMRSFDDEQVSIASLARRFDPQQGFDALFDPNSVKVVMDSDSFALYFSRSIIPYVRNYDWKKWTEKAEFFTHVGLYGYKASTLAELCALPQSPLEIAESLEQLRWLQGGYHIKMSVTDVTNFGIDTPSDLEAANAYLESLEK